MTKLDKQIKQLVAALKAEKKKRKAKKAGKRKQKTKKGASLAEYAKNKLLLDLQAKALMSGSGGGAAPLQPKVANYDTERVKTELQDLKDKMREEKARMSTEMNRLQTGVDQYRHQLALEMEEKANPRQGFVGANGDMFALDDLQPLYDELQSQIMGINSKVQDLDAGLQLARANDNEALVQKIEAQQEELRRAAEAVEQRRQKLAAAAEKRRATIARRKEEAAALREAEEGLNEAVTEAKAMGERTARKMTDLCVKIDDLSLDGKNAPDAPRSSTTSGHMWEEEIKHDDSVAASAAASDMDDKWKQQAWATLIDQKDPETGLPFQWLEIRDVLMTEGVSKALPMIFDYYCEINPMMSSWTNYLLATSHFTKEELGDPTTRAARRRIELKIKKLAKKEADANLTAMQFYRKHGAELMKDE